MRFLLAIIAWTFLSFIFAAWIAIPANEEVQFWQMVVERRDSEIARLRLERPDTPIIFFAGGSSCAFSIDSAIIEKTCGIPAFNLGLPVSSGGPYLIHHAFSRTRPGDIVVICLEPDLLTTHSTETTPSRFSLAMAVSEGTPSDAGGGNELGKIPDFRDYLTLARPGANHIATLLGKIATGRGYRYTADDLRYHGRVETPIHNPGVSASRKSSTSLTPKGRELLETAARIASKQGVHVVYSMPWLLTATEVVDTNRGCNLSILSSIRSILPAIDDGFAGAHDDANLFADTGLHLSVSGSAIRSQALADALSAWLASP